MRTKHFVNDATAVVEAALKSLMIVQPELRLDIENKIVYAAAPPEGQTHVSIISGGGAGHEPSFSGFVGDGLLTAAVSGTIFASPSSRQVLNAVENVDASKGVLITVMNYTGDVLNFGVALEKARARNPAMKIEMLVVGDDVAVTRSRAGKVGRRGIAGTVLVHKVTGAMAAAGYSLDQITRVGRLVAENVASIGASLSRVHVPGRVLEKEAQEIDLELGEIELGMGIHNESGCGRRNQQDTDHSSLISEMLLQILDTEDPERNYLPRRTDEMVLLINNLGGLSNLELGATVTEVVEQLQRNHRIATPRVYAGTFMTSLDGPGFSISLLNVVDTGLDTTLLDLLDAPSNASGWQAPTRTAVGEAVKLLHTSNLKKDENVYTDQLICDVGALASGLDTGLVAIIAAEPEVTQYDMIVGDGDCGTTLKRGAKAIQKALQENPPQGLVALLTLVTVAVESTMDGTSGALYSIFLNSLLVYVKLESRNSTRVDVEFWIRVLSAALTDMRKYTPAQIGDRTLMDALIPFVKALRADGTMQAAARAAMEGAAETKSMRPGLGRTVYIGNEDAWLGKVPDPGAWGLSKFFEGIARA